jgi:hypothetical protein
MRNFHTQIWGVLGATRTTPVRFSMAPGRIAVRSYAIGKPGGAACGLPVRNPLGVGAPDSLPTHYLLLRPSKRPTGLVGFGV